MSSTNLLSNLRIIQKNLKIIFDLLEIPFKVQIESIISLSEKNIEENKPKILKNLNEILNIFKQIESEKLIQITDFKKFLNEIIPIIKEINFILKKSQISKYIHLYLLIQVYWFIEYFIKHEIEFKNNEFFNENVHYKWIIDDSCLDFLMQLKKQPKTAHELISKLDKSRLLSLIETKMIKIENNQVILTSLGNIMIDLANIGELYIYYIDEFNEIFEEYKEGF
ncbi:MAG: hypothetical protein ACTSO9_20180 [Candidatus Helarchaeota archaeon]